MARRKTYTTEPRTYLNQWVRDALEHMYDTQGIDLTYDEIADHLNRAKLGSSYDKSKVQKMTTIRQLKLAEAAVISRLTGLPLPDEKGDADQVRGGIMSIYDELPPDRKRELERYAQYLLSQQGTEQAGEDG